MIMFCPDCTVILLLLKGIMKKIERFTKFMDTTTLSNQRQTPEMHYMDDKLT